MTTQTPRRGSFFARLLAEAVASDPDIRRLLGDGEDTRTPAEKAEQDNITRDIQSTIVSATPSFNKASEYLVALRRVYGRVVSIKGADDEVIQMLKHIDDAESTLRAFVKAAEEYAAERRDDVEPPF